MHLPTRRALLLAAVAAPLARLRAAEPEVAALLRAGGVVMAFRHALAPGTFDPPGFKLGECVTQRNLDDAGRAQARRIGEWFRERRLQPERVRSSPWCRCVDTAMLAFGTAAVWPALGSPRAAGANANADALRELRAAVVEATRRAGRFEVWVTHQFVLSELMGQPTASGEGLVLRADADAVPRVLARLALA